jgi:trehalose 6-phosphate phosphatase
VLVDFDGSVSEIVDDPADARVLPEARAALAALARRMALVGVVSGRPVEFLAEALELPALALVGQYGLERLVDGRVVVDERAEPYLPAVAAAAGELEAALPGLLIERKAGVAVTVHWRQDSGRAGAAAAAAAEVAGRHGLAVHATRMARELRPPVAVDKGTGVEGLLAAAEPKVAMFAGDDRGDLDAFAALDRLTALGKLEHAVKVAVASSEAPPELLASGDVVVDGPVGLAALLGGLADATAG